MIMWRIGRAALRWDRSSRAPSRRAYRLVCIGAVVDTYAQHQRSEEASRDAPAISRWRQTSSRRCPARRSEARFGRPLHRQTCHALWRFPSHRQIIDLRSLSQERGASLPLTIAQVSRLAQVTDGKQDKWSEGLIEGAPVRALVLEANAATRKISFSIKPSRLPAEEDEMDVDEPEPPTLTSLLRQGESDEEDESDVEIDLGFESDALSEDGAAFAASVLPPRVSQCLSRYGFSMLIERAVTLEGVKGLTSQGR